MVDFTAANRPTLLLVDDDKNQLELRALVLKILGFTALTAAGPAKAISLVAEDSRPHLDLAILDYDMPMMNGCVLADYLREYYPGLKVIVHSGAVHVPETTSDSVNSFVAKGEGVTQLLAQISALLGQAEATPRAVSLDGWLNVAGSP